MTTFKACTEKIAILAEMILIGFLIIFIIRAIGITDRKPKVELPGPLIQQEIAEEQVSNEIYSKELQTALKWAESVERTEPVLTIWNSITKEGCLLEDGQNYTLQEGDKLVLCFNEQKEAKLAMGFGIACSVGKGKCFYSMDIQEALTIPTEVTLTLTLDGVEYETTVYLQTA